MTQLPDPDSRDGPPKPEDLAAEFVSRKAAGEVVDVAEYLRRISDVAKRKEFQELVAGAGAAERGLPRTLAEGSRIAGRYRILRAIGSGGMGRVFAAFDEKLGREVAVKVLAPLAAGNREREQMFEREWRLLAELKHPGIVAVHDAGNDGEFTYIVMDLVEGTAVSDVIERARREVEAAGRSAARTGETLARAIGRPASPGRRGLIDPHDWYRSSARILLEIAQTLEAAHAKKVVHRDLKPANVMLLGDGTPVVLDFGLAGSPDIRKAGVTESLHGSLPYVAPEQARSEKVGMDPRTDVYQLGLILYEFLTLRRAFPGTAIGEVLERIKQGYFVRPRKIDPAVPRDLEAICTMALELSPDRRYASARALREDLERFLEGRAPIASRSARWRSFVRTLRYTARRHPVLSGAAGMFLVGGVTWGFLPRRDLGVPTNFFRMEPQGDDFRFVEIREGEKEIHVGDYLGFTLRSTGGVEVYVLSCYGSEGGQRFLSPWMATGPKHLERVHKVKTPDDDWGLHVETPVAQVVCTQLDSDGTPNDYEGALVLVSPDRDPRIEDWMDALYKKQASTGVAWSEALDLLAHLPPISVDRGLRNKAPAPLSPPKAENLGKRLLQAEGDETRNLGLPNVKEFQIECRVARK